MYASLHLKATPFEISRFLLWYYEAIHRIEHSATKFQTTSFNSLFNDGFVITIFDFVNKLHEAVVIDISKRILIN